MTEVWEVKSVNLRYATIRQLTARNRGYCASASSVVESLYQTLTWKPGVDHGIEEMFFVMYRRPFYQERLALMSGPSSSKDHAVSLS